MEQNINLLHALKQNIASKNKSVNNVIQAALRLLNTETLANANELHMSVIHRRQGWHWRWFGA